MEGVPKSTLPDIRENRGPALQLDQTPNSISRSHQHPRHPRPPLFAFLAPLALASLCAMRLSRTPHTITDTFTILDTDGNHLLSKHHHQESIPSSSKALASTRERRTFEKDWWQTIKTILRRGRGDRQFGDRQTDFVFVRTSRRRFPVRPCVI